MSRLRYHNPIHEGVAITFFEHLDKTHAQSVSDNLISVVGYNNFFGDRILLFKPLLPFTFGDTETSVMCLVETGHHN